MTYTILLFLYRLPHISPSAFQTHYDTVHMPLLESLAGPLFPISHTRSYIHRPSIPPSTANASSSESTTDSSKENTVSYPAQILYGAQEDVPFDAIAELVFRDEEACFAYIKRLEEEDAVARIAADETHFLERKKMAVVVLRAKSMTRGQE